jgi:hypothetical protein
MEQLVGVDSQTATKRARCRLVDMELLKQDIQVLATRMDRLVGMAAVTRTEREALHSNNNDLAMDLQGMAVWEGATVKTQ